MPFDIEWPITASASLGIKNVRALPPQRCEDPSVLNSKRKGRRMDEYCSFPEIILIAPHPNPPIRRHTQKSEQYIYLLCIRPGALSWRHSRNYASTGGKTVGGGRGAAEEKGSNDPVTFDTLLQMQNGYSSRNLTKRASFDGKRYRQWPVAGSVGCLGASREAYQMTLKISSTTIKFEGGTAQGAADPVRLGMQVHQTVGASHKRPGLIIPLLPSSRIVRDRNYSSSPKPKKGGLIKIKETIRLHLHFKKCDTVFSPHTL